MLWIPPELRAGHWERRLWKSRSQRSRNRVFLGCAPSIGKGFPSGNACAVRAARNFVQGRWNGRNRPRKCPRPAVEYRRRDIAPPRDARERLSIEPSCTQCLKPVVTGSIVRKDPHQRTVEKQWCECGKNR